MNDFIGAFKKYAVFSGRSTRTEYWMFFLYSACITIILSASLIFIKGGMGTIVALIILIYWLAALIPFLAVLVRRIHDINLNGWWILIGLIPSIGQLVLFIFSVIDSTPGENKYGSNPKGVPSVATSVAPTITN